MKIFWNASSLQMAENDIFYIKLGSDDDGAMEKWL